MSALVVTSIATKEQFEKLDRATWPMNPLPTWDELVAQGKVEDGRVAIMVYPDHVSYTRPSDYEAMHESGELEVVPDVYSTAVILPGAFNWDGKADSDLVADLKALRADIDRALMLLAREDVELTFEDFDHHYGGSTCFNFETTDAKVAEDLEFDEVMRAGAEDFEIAPWAKVQS